MLYANIRFGSDTSGGSINPATGGLKQPFYQGTDGTFFKLTYSNYDLIYAIMAGGAPNNDYFGTFGVNELLVRTT